MDLLGLWEDETSIMSYNRSITVMRALLSSTSLSCNPCLIVAPSPQFMTYELTYIYYTGFIIPPPSLNLVFSSVQILKSQTYRKYFLKLDGLDGGGPASSEVYVRLLIRLSD